MSEHLSECSTKVLGTSNVSANIRLKKEGNLDDFLKGKKIDRQTISNLDLKRMGARHPNVCDEGYKLNNKSQKGKIPYYGKRNLNAYLTHSTKSEKPMGNFLMSRDENIIDVVDERVNKDTSKITDSLIRIKEENGESCSSISLTECFDEIEQAKLDTLITLDPTIRSRQGNIESHDSTDAVHGFDQIAPIEVDHPKSVNLSIGIKGEYKESND